MRRRSAFSPASRSSAAANDSASRGGTSRPDGAPRKLLDVSRLAALGWSARTGLEAGLRRTYDWYLANMSSARA